jgi:hypothetical protein
MAELKASSQEPPRMIKPKVTEKAFENLKRKALLSTWPAPSTRDEEAIAIHTRTLSQRQLISSLIAMLSTDIPTGNIKAQQLGQMMKVYVYEFYRRGYDPDCISAHAGEASTSS